MVFFLLLPFFLLSCGKSAAELKLYIDSPENGLVQKVDGSWAAYTLQYRPNVLNYVSLQEKGYSYEGYMEQNEGNSSFVLDIMINQNQVLDDKYRLMAIRDEYRNETNGKYIKLSEGGLEYPCLIYHCESSEKNHYRIDLLFPRGASRMEDDWIISYWDPVSGDKLKFLFEKNNIEKVPSLKK